MRSSVKLSQICFIGGTTGRYTKLWKLLLGVDCRVFMSEAFPVGADQSLDPGGQCPVGDDDPMRMEGSIRRNVSGNDITPENGSVVRVGVPGQQDFH